MDLNHNNELMSLFATGLCMYSTVNLQFFSLQPFLQECGIG